MRPVVNSDTQTIDQFAAQPTTHESDRHSPFNTQVEFHPAMNMEDLKKATPGIEKAVKNYYSAARAKAA
jgi:hypothetical protein